MTESNSPTSTDEPQRTDFWLAHWLEIGRLRWLVVILLYVIIQPPESGLGIDLCTVHRLTNAPCPGCGMTRSGANIVRGNLRRAWQYHPLGLIFTPILVVLTIVSFMPQSIRSMIASRFRRNRKVWQLITIVLLAVFIVFGLVRFALVCKNLMSFPFES